jgi:hypothetical protein
MRANRVGLFILSATLVVGGLTIGSLARGATWACPPGTAVRDIRDTSRCVPPNEPVPSLPPCLSETDCPPPPWEWGVHPETKVAHPGRYVTIAGIGVGLGLVVLAVALRRRRGETPAADIDPPPAYRG